MVQSPGQQGARDEGGRHHSGLAAPTQRFRQLRGVQSVLQQSASMTPGNLSSQGVNCLGRTTSLKLPC